MLLTNYKIVTRDNKGDFCDISACDKCIAKNPNLKQITTHGLRHTRASLLFEENKDISVSEVEYMLGHRNAKTTLDIDTSITNKNRI